MIKPASTSCGPGQMIRSWIKSWLKLAEPWRKRRRCRLCAQSPNRSGRPHQVARKGIQYPFTCDSGDFTTVCISAASSGVTRSSASIERIHLPRASASARFFCGPYPGQSVTSTLAPNDCAIATVWSVLPESSTMSSSAIGATVSRQRARQCSSSRVMTTAVSLGARTESSSIDSAHVESMAELDHPPDPKLAAKGEVGRLAANIDPLNLVGIGQRQPVDAVPHPKRQGNPQPAEQPCELAHASLRARPVGVRQSRGETEPVRTEELDVLSDIVLDFAHGERGERAVRVRMQCELDQLRIKFTQPIGRHQPCPIVAP